MLRRTKIVCTLGPAVDDRDKIRALIDAGMNVARLNCSHGDWETRRRWADWVRELSGDIAPVAVLVDLQGPKFRLGDLEGGSREIATDEVLLLGPEGADLPIHQPEVMATIATGDRILLGDGEVELEAIGAAGRNFRVRTVIGGLVRSRKGVTLPNKAFDVPSMTEKDIEDVHEAARIGADYIALSYVRSASDVRDLRRLIDRLDPSIGVCAKIETPEAIEDLDEILRIVDLVMVARGDMGLQMELEQVPIRQKQIIAQCSWAGIPVITATQMLESMIVNPRPTRAEATDVANAILDGTDAVMLSAETAAGKYPIECVRTMVRIAERTEPIYDCGRIEKEFQRKASLGTVSHTEAIAHSASELSTLIDPRAIITTSTSGQTPRLVSKYRPATPILCATWSERTRNRMAVVWGVESMTVAQPQTTDEIVQVAIDAFFRKKRLKIGDQVIITAGVPAGTAGNTNLIITDTVR